MGACLDAVIPYVKARKQFGKPIGRMQLIQAKLADMYTRFMASRELVYSVARSADAGNMSPSLCASAILFSAESATKVALDAVQCLGGYGYMNEYPVAKLLRDAKLYEIGAGTSEIRRIVIAKDIIKKPLDI